MSAWGPGEWTLFFTAVCTVIGTLTTSIIAIINAAKANKSAIEAKDRAAKAEGKSEATLHQAQSTADRVVDLAHKMESPK